MRIGIMSGATGGAGLEQLLRSAVDAETAGFATLWMAHIFGLDAIGSLAIAGRETRRIELGTAVVPTYPRHPVAMAQQALTAQAACAGRFTLGIGLSHKLVIEDMLGYSYEKPARHMREYLEALVPLMAGERVDIDGDEYRIHAQLEVPGVEPPRLLVAALGPIMLGLAGRLTDGTITWMCGPQTLESHIGPRLRKAASEAGRDEPRIVAGLPVILTTQVEKARAKTAELLQIYGQLPSYRAMLDREGVGGPADVALIGDESALRTGIRRLAEVGVTDFDAAPVPVEHGAVERTVEFLASLT